MGLLDQFNMNPQAAMLLGLGAGLLDAGAPSTEPRNIGRGMSNGLLMGTGMMQTAQQGQMDDMRRQVMQQELQKKQMLMDILGPGLGGQSPQGGQGGPGPSPGLGGGSMSPQGMGGGAPMGGGMPPGGPPQDGQPGGGQMPGNGLNARNGGFPLNLQQVMAVKALGGTDLFPEYKYVNDGIKREGGSYYKNPMTGEMQYMPTIPEGMTITSDGRMAPIPGYVGGIAAVEGAKTGASEGAKAQFDLVQVVDPQGNVRMIPRAQALGMSGGGAAPGGTPPGGGGGQPPGAGFGGAPMASRNPADQAYDTDTAKYWAETGKAIQKSGMEAPGVMSKLTTLQTLLQDHDGGKLSPTGVQIASLANSLGLNIDKNLGNKQAAESISNALALSARSTSEGGGMPGALSDADRNFLAGMTPNIAQSAAGRELVIGIQKGMAQRQIDVAKMARQWEGRFGRLDRQDGTGKSFFDYLDAWRNQNPLISQQQPQEGQ